MLEAPRIRNAMTVDVEDYFQVSALSAQYPRGVWDAQPCRIEQNMARVLGLFDDAGVKATFFTLGWIAERYPQLVRDIVAGGHELASHGYAHRRASEQTREEFREDVARSKALLEDIGGVAVQGYRAPSFSIGRSNLWALQTLAELGFQYSSSIYPIQHDHYGMPGSSRFPWQPHARGVLELPLTTVRIASRNLPAAGGGYFRLLPYAASAWALRRVNGLDRQPGIFYFHPWELDPEQPRARGIALKTRVRHYLNLGRTTARIRRLLTDFDWGRMDDVFKR